MKRPLAFASLLAFAACSSGAVVGPEPAHTSVPATPQPGTSATPQPGSSATPKPGASPTATAGQSSNCTGNADVPFPSATDSDAFYAQPCPFPVGDAPGTILDSRPSTYAPVGGATQPNTAYQVKFVSRDTNGNPIAAVTTIVIPLTPSLTSPQPLLVDGLAEDALGSQCAPSHDIAGSTADSNEEIEASLVTLGLAQGWVVDYPDYEGPWSAYGSGPLAGYISLDSIRATENFAPAKLNAKTPVGVYGYSGGGFLTGWTATLQRSYAPELNIVGIASGGTPANPQSIAENVDDPTHLANLTTFALVFSAIEGINRSYPGFFTPILNAKGVAAAIGLANGCDGAATGSATAPSGSFEVYTTVSDPLHSPTFEAIYPKITLAQPGQPPMANVYVFHSQLDELMPIAYVDQMVAAWCAAGSTVEYYRGVSGEHVSFDLTAGPLGYEYLEGRFAGQTITPPGTTTCN